MPPPALGTPMEMVAPMKQMYATTNGGEPLYAVIDEGYGIMPMAGLEGTSVTFVQPVQQVQLTSVPPPGHQQAQMQQQLQHQHAHHPPDAHRSEGRSVWDMTEEDQLKMRRDEIINRLAAMQHDPPHHRLRDRPWLDDGHQHPDEEDGSSHVSFTVATSVLHDAERDAAANLELPPLPLRFNSIISSSVESL